MINTYYETTTGRWVHAKSYAEALRTARYVLGIANPNLQRR